MELQMANYKIPGLELLQMQNSQAMGIPLVLDKFFGADMLVFQPWETTETHTHEGDHILFVVSGSGILIFDGALNVIYEGDCYFVPGSVPHKVSASGETLYLLSVANYHQPVDSQVRSALV